jgi:Eco29kI restriction endonuclease
MAHPPFNPLDKRHLGESVASALLARPIGPLPPPERFIGAGIYAIYYSGDCPSYDHIAAQNKREFQQPIYVGKAVPPGARKGGFGLGTAPGIALYSRLSEHANSIDLARNLRLEDFRCRYLLSDDIWIPLGESLTIERFQPVWNILIDGFGNHPPGSGRGRQERSRWDTLHPGRAWASELPPNRLSQNQLRDLLHDFFSGKVAPSVRPEEAVQEED